MLALASMMMSLCIPAKAQQLNDSMMAVVDSLYQEYLRGEGIIWKLVQSLPGVIIPEGEESKYTVNGPPFRSTRMWKGASVIETSDPQIHIPDTILYRFSESPLSKGAQQSAEKIRGAFIIGSR